MLAVALLAILLCSVRVLAMAKQQLRFDENGEFRILQVADMHYANGKTTACLDVLPQQVSSCTDLNTSDFIRRMIKAEKPHLIVFTGKLSIFSLSWMYYHTYFVSSLVTKRRNMKTTITLY